MLVRPKPFSVVIQKMWICLARVCVQYTELKKTIFCHVDKRKNIENLKMWIHTFSMYEQKTRKMHNFSFFIFLFVIVSSPCVFTKCPQWKKMCPLPCVVCAFGCFTKKVSEVQVLLLLKKFKNKRTRSSQSLVQASTLEVHKKMLKRNDKNISWYDNPFESKNENQRSSTKTPLILEFKK